ncbi:kinase-like domain-containing protein [Mycena metata]|uniref:Kinase-like domain-containing protein n=1 Tax=Mycena metata TaxID=1033252 RepID=A0AAD7NWT5_9AGAR|nr:kinase-like domain-containing protein [Mycena metata]
MPSQFSSNLGYTNHPLLRAALRADDKALAKLIASIFNAEAEAAALALEGESAQRFLDVVHDTLTRGLFSQEESQQARRLIRRLADSCDKLPSSLFITGVTGREDHPTFGGGFGDIYRATHTGKSVALKHMRHFLQGSDLRRIRSKFCREALVWKDLNHPHILAFIGIDREHFPSSLCMVSPWMEHGTVLKYSVLRFLDPLWAKLYEIAQGLQYLHSRNIVHGDLRGTNILITQDWTACLADFGLSTFADANPSSTLNQGGSLHWMAPELLDPGRFGTKFCRTPATDVYAFGCVCLEVT